MQVYKAYFKVIKKHLPSILIYFIAFMITSFIITVSIPRNTDSAFSSTKNKIAIFNEDAGSALTEGLVGYLSSNARVVSIDDDVESIQDALFYGDADYVLRIPAGFSSSFMRGENPLLQKTTAASTPASVSLDLIINKYLNLAAFYRDNLSGISESSIADYVARDLAHSTDVRLSATRAQSNTTDISYYFSFSAYPILAVMIMGVTTIMIVFQEGNLARRNLCSPLSPFRMNLQLCLGNASLAAAVWLIICAYNLLLFRKTAMGFGVILLCLNALVFTVVSLSIGFLAGKFLKTGVSQAAFANVASLGISFISGIFVDQSLLGESVLKIASFLPGYWYVRAVNAIRYLSDYSLRNLTPFLYDLLIQLGFAAAFITLALVAAKYQKTARA